MKERKIERNMLPVKFSCPRCNCHALYRTRRKGLDWVMSGIGLRPVRCMTCDRRFYLRYSLIQDTDPDPPKSMQSQKAANPRKESHRAA